MTEREKTHKLMLEMIEKIKNEEMRETCKKFYMDNLEKWHTIPCSESGRYHLEPDQKSTTLAKHTASVMQLSWMMCEQIGLYATRDHILTGSFSHDSEKIHGANNSDHAERSAKMTQLRFKDKISDHANETIHGIIMSHGGKWYKDLPVPETIEQQIVAFADYLDSKLLIEERPKYITKKERKKMEKEALESK